MSAARVSCGETVWSSRDEAGNIVQQHTKPCPNRAKVEARVIGTTTWVPLCGRHENTDRWANYVDVAWRTIDGDPLPNPWDAIDTDA